MSNKKKAKHPFITNHFHRTDRNISREMKKLNQKKFWSNKNIN